LTPKTALAAALGGAAALSLGPSLACRQTTPAPTRPNIVLLVWETTRADHVSALSYPLRTTPNLELLAAEGVVFDNNIATAPWTLPSVTSLMTGLSPTAHGVQTYEDGLGPQDPTLAERLRGAGYTTALLGVNTFFEADKGLERGFDFYFGQGDVPGPELSDRMQGWLDSRPTDRPFFLYLHIFEPHCPYDPPPEYAHVFDPRPASLSTDRAYTRDEWDRVFGCFRLPPPGAAGQAVLDMNSYLSAYDANLHYTDHLTGIMIQRLQTRGLMDDTLVVFVGDHGEEFLEHGDHGHGRHLYQESIHVPLIIRPAGTAKARARFAGRRVGALTSSVDIAPTILAVAGIDPKALPQTEPQLEGIDLSPTWLGRGPPRQLADRAAFAGTDHEAHLRSVQHGDWKLIVDVGQPVQDPDLPPTPTAQPPPLLFQLESDPEELHDVAQEHPDIVRELMQSLQQHETADLARAAKIGHSARPLDQETRLALRRLGYLE